MKLTGEKLISDIWEPHTDMRDSKRVRKLRLISHSELRRRGRGLELQREGRQFAGRWEGLMFGKHLPCHVETMG